MSKVEFEKGQYVVHIQDEKEVEKILIRELDRFYEMRYMMADLLVENGEAWENFMNNTSEERLNIHFNDETSLIYEEDATSKGRVRRIRPDDEKGYFSYDLAYRYPDIQGYNADFRLAHEMGHLMLNPSHANRQVYDEETKSWHISGLIRAPKGEEGNPNSYYGEKMHENAINLIAQLAIRENHSADDIITGKVDLSEPNSYRKTDNLIKELVLAMRNDFDREISFEQLAKGRLDSFIRHSDGTKEPANLFFYGILNNSGIIEKEFDKYMGKGAWRELDEAITQLQQSDITKERFNLIYKMAQGLITDFAKLRMQEKYRESIARNGEENVPALESKMQMIQEVILISLENQEQQEKNSLTLKQKVAQYLRKHDIFMNLEFVKGFVEKQLNVLPEPKQTANIAVGRLRKDFENRISDNGKLKLPKSKRTSNPSIMENLPIEQKKSDGR